MTKLKNAVEKSHGKERIAEVLAAETPGLARAGHEERISRLAGLATHFGVLPPDPGGAVEWGESLWLAEFALRLASSPKDLSAWAGPRLRQGVVRLLEVPALARAARFLVLATNRHLDLPEAPGELYSSWGWT